ncbi:MAG: TetR/AcrR family transcriptional regulator [Bacteroidales bacterium]|nr:TetR/AcrR family transcriptional regulator [Bacteroidales bacterium]
MLKRENTKQRILDDAIALFKDKGIQKTTIDEIVKRSCLAKGTFFYHFSQKDQIVYEIIDRAFKEYFNITEQIAGNKGLTAIEKIKNVMLSLFTNLSASEELDEIFQHGVPMQFELYINELRLNKLIPIISGIIEQGNIEGSFSVRNIDIFSSILNRGIVGYIHYNYPSIKQPTDFRKMLDGIEELVNNAIGTKQKINFF